MTVDNKSAASTDYRNFFGKTIRRAVEDYKERYTPDPAPLDALLRGTRELNSGRGLVLRSLYLNILGTSSVSRFTGEVVYDRTKDPQSPYSGYRMRLDATFDVVGSEELVRENLLKYGNGSTIQVAVVDGEVLRRYKGGILPLASYITIVWDANQGMATRYGRSLKHSGVIPEETNEDHNHTIKEEGFPKLLVAARDAFERARRRKRITS